MNDDSIVKIMQTLGLNYKPAIDSTEEFEKAVSGLDKQLASMKDTAIQSAKDINQAFTNELKNLKVSEIKKVFDQIDKYNKPVEIKVTTDKAEKAMNEFARTMGIKVDKNLKNQINGLVDSFLGDFDQSKVDELAGSIADSYEKAMKRYTKRINKSTFADTDDVKIYEYLQKTTLKLDQSTIEAKKNVDGFSHAIRNLAKQSENSGMSLDKMAQELEEFGVRGLGANTEDIAERMTLAVERVREMKHGFSDLGFDVPRGEIDKFVQESLGDLLTTLFQIKTETMNANKSLSSLGDTAESAGNKTGGLTDSQKRQSETIQEVIRQYKAGVMEAKEFIRIADELKVNKDQWGSLPVQAKQDQISLQNSLTKATREYAKSLKELEQYKDALTGTGDFSKQQAEITKQMNELIRLRKTLQIDAKEFMERASKIGPGTKAWDSLKSKDQVKLVNEITKAEREHTKVLQEEAKIERALRGEKKANVEEIKKGTLEKMKSQAASIQQRATTKKLSKEYAEQASTIRQQLEVLQTKLQLEGKLSAEEIKQTQQLQEQLNILKAQTGTAISDKIRENPNFLGEEFRRRTSWFLTGTMFYGIVNGAKKATEAIKDVEMGMVEIARVMDDSSFVFDEYRDKLFQLGVDYGQTFENVQQIALRWAQSGYNVKDSLELAETSLLALNTAELDATQATEAMIGIMAQWQLQAEDMALVMDKVNITADNYSVTSQDLVDGLLRSSGAARIMNLSMDETIGLLTVMREASGRTGQEVGNALNSILSYIQRPKSIDLLESLGISMFTDKAKTQFRSVLDVFKDIASNWNTLSAEIQDGFVKSADDADLFNEELATALGMQKEWNDLQQRDISQAAAGVYRRNYFIGMIERLSNVQGVLNNMMDAEGYSMRENEKTMEALDKKQQSLKASLQELAVAMGDAGVGGSLKSLAQGGTSALNAINKMDKPAKDWLMATTNMFLAVKALDLGMKTFGINLPGVSEMIKELTNGTWSLTKAFKAGKEGIGTFLSANGPLLAISASIGVIVAVTNHMKKEREEKEKAIQVSKENIQSLEEEKQGLTELASEYETLKEKEKNLTATADEKIRLRDIQRELVDLYGVSISGIDAEGQAYADSTTAIQDRIKALEELKAIEIEKLESAVISKDKQDVEELEKNIEKRKQISKDIADVQKQIDEQLRILERGGTTTAPTGKGRRYRIDASTEGGAKLLKEYIGRLNSDKADLQAALDSVNTTIEEGTSDRERLLKDDAAKIVQQLERNGTKVSDEARAYANELAKALSQAPEDIFTLRDELEEAIRGFASSDFESLMRDLERFKENGNTEGLDKTKIAIMNLVEGLVKAYPLLENWGLAIEQYLDDSSNGAASSLDKLSKSASEVEMYLGNMLKTYSDALDDVNSAIAEYEKNNSFSKATLDKIIDTYPQLIKYLGDEKRLYEELKKIQKEKTVEAQKNLNDELKALENSINNKLTGYKIDLKNWRNIEQAKLAITQQLVQRVLAEYDKIYGKTKSEEEAYLHAMKTRKYLGERVGDALPDIDMYLSLKSFDVSEYFSSPSKGSKSSKEKKPKEKKYENKALDNALKMLEHRKKMTEETQKSIQAEINELNRINKLYVKTADERMDMAERIYAAEKRLKDKRLQDSVNWINEKKNLDKLSVEEEIAAWERVSKNQSNNIEARKQAELNLYKLRTQIMTESYSKEENSIQHLTKLGVYSVEHQIEKYKELYKVKAKSAEEEQSRVENLFGLYKKLISDQQKTVKTAYDKRIESIEEEAKKKKSVHDEEIKAIEKELELLDRKENEYDHDKKMADLQEQLKYWQVRTSEDARKKVAEILKQIDEEEHKREVELKKQGLEDKKKVLQDENKAIDDAAKNEKDKWEKSYKQIEIAFDEHSIDMIALASTMSKGMYDEFKKNYLDKIEEALKSGDYGSVESTLSEVDSFAKNAYEKTYNSKNAQIYRLASQILDYKYQYEYGGDKNAAQRALSYYGELEKLSPSVAKYLHKSNYMTAKEYIDRLPRAHTGAKTLSYGAVYMKPGELIFPPDLSTKMEGLIAALYARPISQNSSSLTDNRSIFNIDKLLNIEKNYMEDDVDGEILARELGRQIVNIP